MKKITLLLLLSFLIAGRAKAQTVKGEPYVAFAGRLAGTATITSGDAMSGMGLGCMLDGKGQVVLSFKLTVESNKATKSAFSNSNKITPEQQQLLKNLPSGSKIIFSEVKVRFKDGSEKIIKDGTYLVN